MTQNSLTIHDGLIMLQAGTIVDTSLITNSSANLFAAQGSVDATFLKMKSDLDAADRKVNDLQNKINRGDKSQATYWDHYSAVIDSMLKTSAWAICWDTIDDLKAMNSQSTQILHHIGGTLDQLNTAISGFAKVSAAFSDMRSQFVSAAGDVDPNANPRFFSERVFRDTLATAALDWMNVKQAVNIFTTNTTSQLQSLGL
ncbi:hypothetical protein ABW20_dc0100729 [Dactylellina cionopaga]|nr:hypothetical protein ABW20_dc0100729 [Dactylellina cionopaga]